MLRVSAVLNLNPFCSPDGIKQVFASPYHPSSNGMAERAVKTVKDGIRKMREGSFNSKLMRFLSKYRITPHETTQRSPAELLLKRMPRTRLDQLRPSIESDVMNAQQRQTRSFNKRSCQRIFEEGQAVSVVNFGRGDNWLEGVVRRQKGPLTYEVELKDGRILKRHIDYILDRQSSSEVKEGRMFTPEQHMRRDHPVEETVDHRRMDQSESRDEQSDSEEVTEEQSQQQDIHIEPVEHTPTEEFARSTKETISEHNINNDVPLRRSTRIRRSPDYFHF